MNYKYEVYKVVNRSYKSVFTRQLGKYALTYRPGTTVTAPDLLPMFVFTNYSVAKEFNQLNLSRGRILTCYTNEVMLTFPLMEGIGPYILNPNRSMRAALTLALSDLNAFHALVRHNGNYPASPRTTAWCTELYILTKEEVKNAHSIQSCR